VADVRAPRCEDAGAMCEDGHVVECIGAADQHAGSGDHQFDETHGGLVVEKGLERGCLRALNADSGQRAHVLNETACCDSSI